MTPTPDPIKTIEEIVDKISTWQGFRDEAMANLPKNVQEFADSTSWAGEELDAERKRLATQAINNELLRARQELFDLYGTPVCDNLHHIKKHQHRASEECPVVKRLTQLKQSQTEGGE